MHIAHIINEDCCPDDVTQDMICPSLTDAITAIIYACDRDSVRLDEIRRVEEGVIGVIQGIDTVIIKEIKCEPFDIAIRDRVRTAFKGIREYDIEGIKARAARLPGFKNPPVIKLENNQFHRVKGGCLFFGFPSNWAVAMRSALKEVGIVVTQSQSQELVAVFFNANSWYQLIKHKDELNSTMSPISVTVNGKSRRQLFYQTPEEAIFAVGMANKSYTESVVMPHFGLSTDNERVNVKVVAKSIYEKHAADFSYFDKSLTESGWNDYWEASEYATPQQMDAALKMLEKLGKESDNRINNSVSTEDILYKSSGVLGLLKGLLEREGLEEKNLIFIGQFAIAVFLVPDPDGRGMLTAQARIYKIENEVAKEISLVAMYKAEIEVKEGLGESILVITPDYGNDDPIEIGFADAEQVRRFIDLTYNDKLFTLCTPMVSKISSKYRH